MHCIILVGSLPSTSNSYESLHSPAQRVTASVFVSTLHSLLVFKANVSRRVNASYLTALWPNLTKKNHEFPSFCTNSSIHEWR